MKNELDKEELLKSFLLGDLSDSDRAAVEDRFLSADDFFQELVLCEDDLIDAYVRDDLTDDERSRFERRFLTNTRTLERIEFARTLFNSLESEKGAHEMALSTKATIPWWGSLFGKLAGSRTALKFALAAALLAVVGGGLWFVIDKTRTPPTVPNEEIAGRTTAAPATNQPAPLSPKGQEQPQPEPPKVALPKETTKGTGVTVATFTLLPGTLRSNESSNSIALPSGATVVRLRLALDGETYHRYRATLSTAEGKRLWTRPEIKGASAKSGGLDLMIAADLLKRGDYVLDLMGANADGKWESVAEYSFRVTRK